MKAGVFVAGPVHIDGHSLNFFVDLANPRAALQVLAASYTAVVMRETADELTFSAYATRHTRMSEDDWYDIAQARFFLNMDALSADPGTLRTVREVVESRYFGNTVPVECGVLLTRAAVEAFQGVAHA